MLLARELPEAGKSWNSGVQSVYSAQGIVEDQNTDKYRQYQCETRPRGLVRCQLDPTTSNFGCADSQCCHY